MASAGFVLRTLVPTSSIYDLSYPNSSAFTSKQYLFVYDNGTALTVAGSNQATIGVMQDSTDGSTRPTVSTVRTVGLTKLVLGADVSPMAYVRSDANGAAVTCVTGEFAEAYVMDGGLSGEQVAAMIIHCKV